MRDLLETLDRISEGPVFGERMGLRKHPPAGKWGLFMLDQQVFSGERERYPAIGITLGRKKVDTVSKIAVTGSDGYYTVMEWDEYWSELGPADSPRIINELISEYVDDFVPITKKDLNVLNKFIHDIEDKSHQSHTSSGL